MDKLVSHRTKELIERMKKFKKETFSKEFIIAAILLNIYVFISIVHLANNNFNWIYVLILTMFVIILVLSVFVIKFNHRFNISPDKEKAVNGFILFSNTVRLLMLSTNIAFVFTLETELNLFEHIIKGVTLVYLIYSLISFIRSYRKFKNRNLVTE